MRVITLGTFDLFHVGHVNLLRRCREIAGTDRVDVYVNSDEFVEAFKGHRPVIPFKERIAVVRACKYVDAASRNPQAERGQSVADVLDMDSIVVVGSDWRDRDYLAQIGVTQEQLDDLRVLVVYVPYGPGTGSTGIRARVVELAAVPA